MQKLVLLFLLLCVPGWCATTQCLATFGKSNSTLQWCVTQNGNITYMHVYTTYYVLINGNEGYMIQDNAHCYADNGQSDTGNWQAAIVSEPNGPNTLPLTITRSTADSTYKLTQKYSWASQKAGVVLTMTLAYPSGQYSTLWRYADVVYGGSDQLLDSTDATTFIWDHPPQAFSMGLMSMIPPGNSTSQYGSFQYAIGSVTDLCGGFSGSWTQFPHQGDSALALYWRLGRKTSTTVSMMYVPMF